MPPLTTPPPSLEPPWPAAALRIVKWLNVTVAPAATRSPRYLAPPSMMFVRALVPTIVTSVATAMSSLIWIVPAGTLIVSAGRVSVAAAIAARRLGHVVPVQAAVESLEPLVTVNVSAWAGAASASAANPAVRAARKRI